MKSPVIQQKKLQIIYPALLLASLYCLSLVERVGGLLRDLSSIAIHYLSIASHGWLGTVGLWSTAGLGVSRAPSQDGSLTPL